MKKHTIVVISVVMITILLTATVIGCTIHWFYSPGVHQIFGYTHIEFFETGYLYKDGQILGRATFSLDATKSHEDETICLRFDPIRDCDQDDPAYTHALLVDINDQNTYDIHISACKLRYSSKPNDLNAPSIEETHHCLLYLDDSNALQTVVMQDERGESYFFVYTSDPVQANDFLKTLLLPNT